MSQVSPLGNGRTKIRNNTKRALGIFSLVLVLLIGFAVAIKGYFLYQAISPNPISFWDKSDEGNQHVINHDKWQRILSKYIVINGETGSTSFNYQSVSLQDQQLLNTYLNQLQAIDPRSFNKDQQLAYWANLYNALTIEVVLRHLPISTIKDIGDGITGPWNMELATVAGKPLTLNNIEHGILRGLWKDPRIHYAINCASIGCPDLLSKPLEGHDISVQLDSAAKRFINQSKGVSLEDNVLTLSNIYSWFSVDFGENERELLQHIHRYAKPTLKQQLKNFSGEIKYQYNWKLNAPK